jgi:hypothetical protein
MDKEPDRNDPSTSQVLPSASIAGKNTSSETLAGAAPEFERNSSANPSSSPNPQRTASIPMPGIPGAGSGAAVAAAPAREAAAGPLFAHDETEDFRRRWDAIQVGFVDEPRGAVEKADKLVADAMKRLADTFSDERAQLERQWARGDNVSTEDLRVALQRYRAFFGRLLSV